jgi:hypothetical protein
VESLDPAAGAAASLLTAGSADEQRGRDEPGGWPGQTELVELIQRIADRNVRALLDEVSVRPQDARWSARRPKS